MIKKLIKKLFNKNCIKCGEVIPKGNEIIHKYKFNIFGQLKAINYMHTVCWCKYHSISFKDYRDKKLKQRIESKEIIDLEKLL